MQIRARKITSKMISNKGGNQPTKLRGIVSVLCIMALLLGLKPTAAAQTWQYPKTLDSKIERVLNLEFNLTLNPEEPINSPITTLDNIPVSLQIMITTLLTGTKERLAWATKENEKLISDLVKTEEKSAIWNYVYIRLLVNKTMLHTMQSEYLSAFWTFYKTHNLLSASIKKHPNLVPLHTLADLFNKGVEISSEYDPMLKLLLPNAIKTDSILLKQNWSVSEKPLFDAFYLFFIKDYDPLNPCPTPKTKVEQLVYTIYFLNTHNPSKIAEIEKSAQFKHAPIDNFIQGWSSLTTGNYAQARQYLNAHLEEKNTVLYKRSSLLGFYFMDIIENKKPSKSKHQEQLQQLPKSNAWRDRMAEKELTVQHNPQLLKARLLCDGQKYEEALSILTSMNSKTIETDNLLEFHYRKGRILFLQKKYNQALAEYQNALNPTIATKSYYKPQAAFDCGEIYRERKDSTNAVKHYKLSLEQANKANRNDIAVKANAALRAFKN